VRQGYVLVWLAGFFRSITVCVASSVVTYVGKETSYITNISKQTELKITLRTTYTLANLLTHKDHGHDKYSLSGVYKLTCPDCHKTYIGQTDRQFSTQYKEHKTAFCNKSYTSSFARHLLEKPHSSGPINNIMQVVQCHRKGAHLKTIDATSILSLLQATVLTTLRPYSLTQSSTPS